MVRQEEIDVAVFGKRQGLSDRQQKQLIKITDTTWARTVMSRSKKTMNKLLNKIKSGIKQGKYKDTGLEQQGRFPFAEPPIKTKKKKGKSKPKKEKGKKEMKQFKEPQKKKAATKKKEGKKAIFPTAPRKIRRKITEERKLKTLFAPSGRKYSKTEIHEGIKSKRAKEYRLKHGIDVNDYEG